MLCFRTTDDRFVDLVLNHPDVRATAQPGTAHKLLSADVLADKRNYCYAGEHGVILFVRLAVGVFDGHVFLLRGGRGATGLALGKRALERLFADAAAHKVVCRVPWGLPAARWYVRRLGFVSCGRHPEQDVEMFVMETTNG